MLRRGHSGNVGPPAGQIGKMANPSIRGVVAAALAVDEVVASPLLSGLGPAMLPLHWNVHACVGDRSRSFPVSPLP